MFTPAPEMLNPSEKIARGPDLGTPWRRANWRFLEQQATRLDPATVVLDVGAGRGDFASLFATRNYLALDVYPYPEVDLVCDITHTVPFKPGSLDAVLLMNVVEHIYDTHSLFEAAARMLKPGGVVIIAIPFMIKIHQAPVDFVRYTHYALTSFAEEHDFEIELLEGFYDPVSLLGEGIGNLHWSVLPALHGPRKYATRILSALLRSTTVMLSTVLGAGQMRPPDQVRSQAPTGYHVVYRKTVPGQVNE